MMHWDGSSNWKKPVYQKIRVICISIVMMPEEVLLMCCATKREWSITSMMRLETEHVL